MKESPPQRSPALPGLGEVVALTIHDLGSRGQGVGRRHDGLVVMVPDTVPGERVWARIVRHHRNHVEAVLEETLDASPERRQPRCIHFGVCGGCALQMMDAPAQRRLKGGRVRELLGRAAGIEAVRVDQVVAVGPEYGYRGRMMLRALVNEGRVVMGMNRRRGPLMDLEECHLPVPGLLARIHSLRAALTAWAKSRRRVRSRMRLDLRYSTAEKTVVASVFCDPGPPAGLRAALARLAASDPDLQVLLGGPRRVHPLQPGRLATEQLMGVAVPLAADVFIQTHARGAEQIYADALDWLVPAAPGRLLDLYGGVGVLARAALPRFGQAVIVEASAAAVRWGRQAAAGMDCEFTCGEARHVVTRLVDQGETFAAAVINPPRGGLHRSLPSALAALEIGRLAFISCDPATLARDLSGLQRAGYEAVRATPYDLFPQTAEVEVLVRLQRPGA